MPNLDINISTTANTSGISQASSAMANLTASEEAYNAKKAQFLTAAEREVAEVDRLVASGKKLQDARLTESSAAAKSIEAGKELIRLQDQAIEPVTTLTRKTGDAAEMSKKIGYVSREASYQIADFSTQVSMGTSAFTAFGMQAPNLINSFTQVGLVAGPAALTLLAVSAALPIVAGGIRMLGASFPQVSAASKKFAEDTSASIDKLVGKIGELDNTQLEKADTTAKNAIESADLLAQKFTAVQTAEASFSAASSTNAATNIASQSGMLDVLGLQQEKFQEIQKLADLQVKALEAAARAKIAEVNAMREQMVLEVWKATMEIKRSEERKIRLGQELIAQQRVLDLVEKENRERDKAKIKRDDQNPGWSAIGSLGKAAGQAIAGDFAGAAFSVKAADASGAQHFQNQGTDAYDASTAESRKNMETGLRSRVDALAENVDKAKEDTAINQDRLDNLYRKLNASDEADAIKIDEITQTLQTSQSAAKIDQLKKTASQNATDITAFLSHVTATTAQEAAAYADAKQIVSDGKVDATELPRLMADLKTLIGSYQAGFMLMSGNMDGNIKMGAKLQEQLAEQVKLIRDVGIKAAGVSADQKTLKAEVERWKSQQQQNLDRGTQ